MGWLAVVITAAVMLSCTVGELIKVGGKKGWTQNVNYTEWSTHHHFYVGDWLYFVFDKHYYSVLEVTKTSYEQCNDVKFVKNVTKGGRDVFNLTEAKPYYFLSSGGYCFHGMKVAIHVEELALSPKPSLSSVKNVGSPRNCNGNNLIFFTMLVIASTWIFLLKVLSL